MDSFRREHPSQTLVAWESGERRGLRCVVSLVEQRPGHVESDVLHVPGRCSGQLFLKEPGEVASADVEVLREFTERVVSVRVRRHQVGDLPQRRSMRPAALAGERRTGTGRRNAACTPQGRGRHRGSSPARGPLRRGREPDRFRRSLPPRCTCCRHGRRSRRARRGTSGIGRRARP